MCAAMLNGNRVVVAHACRYNGEPVIVGKMALFYPFEKFLHGGEFRCYLLLVIGVACHAHKPPNLYILQAAPFAIVKHCRAFVGCESEFCLFLCNVYLQQAWYPSPHLYPVPVDLFEQVLAVDAVDKVYEWCYIFDFVALEVTDEMPLYILGQHSVFYFKVLGLALAKLALSCIVGRFNSFGRVVF